MKKITALIAAITVSSTLCSCYSKSRDTDRPAADTAATTVTAAEKETGSVTEETTEKVTVAPQEVGFEGMKAIPASSVKAGEYDITVDSSSSMFKITACRLIADGEKLNAEMTMSGSGYRYLFMGTGEEAENAGESDYISAEEDGEEVRFTVPVEALDKEIDCAAYSKRKEQWYDRKLVFRADSLPLEALGEGAFTSVESLSLEDGEYTVDVKLEGGSGRASVSSPAKLAVKDGAATAEIVWSSNKYDYMIVGGEKLLPVTMEEVSVFEVPVSAFDCKIAVSADTTAMSTPHEIEYTLFFDSPSISR